MAILIYGSGGGEGTSVSDTTAVQSDVLPGKYFYLADGTRVEGSMATKAAATIIPSTSNQTINADQYLSGAQTIQGDSDLVAAKIPVGVNLFNITGTYTSDATATAAKIETGYTAYVNGAKLTGTGHIFWNGRSPIDTTEFTYTTLPLPSYNKHIQRAFAMNRNFALSELSTSYQYILTANYEYGESTTSGICLYYDGGWYIDNKNNMYTANIDGNGNVTLVRTGVYRFITVDDYLCYLFGWDE